MTQKIEPQVIHGITDIAFNDYDESTWWPAIRPLMQDVTTVQVCFKVMFIHF